MPGAQGPPWGSPWLDPGAGPFADAPRQREGGQLPSANTAYPGIVTADSPSVYYRLGDFAAPAVPVAGLGVNAAMTGTVRFGEPGAIAGDNDTSCWFPGDGLNYLQTATSPGAAYDLGDGPFSIEFWYRWGGYWPAQTIANALGKGTGAFVVRLNSTGRWVLRKSGTGDEFVTAASFTDKDSWHHVVVTKSGAGAQPHIYVDSLDQAGTFTTQAYANTATGFSIGVDAAAKTVGGWVGYLDDVALYKAALSQYQVTAHYLAGLGLPPQPPLPPPAARPRTGAAAAYAARRRAAPALAVPAVAVPLAVGVPRPHLAARLAVRPRPAVTLPAAEVFQPLPALPATRRRTWMLPTARRRPAGGPAAAGVPVSAWRARRMLPVTRSRQAPLPPPPVVAAPPASAPGGQRARRLAFRGRAGRMVPAPGPGFTPPPAAPAPASARARRATTRIRGGRVAAPAPAPVVAAPVAGVPAQPRARRVVAWRRRTASVPAALPPPAAASQPRRRTPVPARRSHPAAVPQPAQPASPPVRRTRRLMLPSRPRAAAPVLRLIPPPPAAPLPPPGRMRSRLAGLFTRFRRRAPALGTAPPPPLPFDGELGGGQPHLVWAAGAPGARYGTGTAHGHGWAGGPGHGRYDAGSPHDSKAAGPAH